MEKAPNRAFNQEKDLVGAFSVIVKLILKPMKHYTALVQILPGHDGEVWRGRADCSQGCQRCNQMIGSSGHRLLPPNWCGTD